jgi:Tfp pilus assembly protein PilN
MAAQDPNAGRMSFLPEDYIQRRIEHRTNLICLSLFAVVLMGVVGAYLVTKGQRAEVMKAQHRINQEYAEAAKRLAQLSELQQRRQQLLSKARVTATLIEPIPRSNLLAELINRMPASLSLLEYDLGSKRLAPPRPPKPKKGRSVMANAREATKTADALPPAPKYLVSVTLVGMAPTDIQVAQYMARLARSPLLDQVDLAYSETARVAGLTMRRFKITLTADIDADIRNIEPLLREDEPGELRNGFTESMQAGVDPVAPMGHTGD